MQCRGQVTRAVRGALSRSGIPLNAARRIPASSSGQNRNASTSASPLPSASPSPPRNTPLAKGKEKKGDEEEVVSPQLQSAAHAFESTGLNARLSLQLVKAFPFIRSPTRAQQALLAAISQDNDIILRAHTGTGKSFGLLLGLLNKPRLVVMEASESTERQKRITSIIVVPSRELALQYNGWAKQLFPESMHNNLSSVVSVKYRERGVSVDDHIEHLIKDAPHVLVITATLLHDLMGVAKGVPMLGLSTLRTLVLDEGDALMELPSRFPSQKLIWNHLKHPSEGLQTLNRIMRMRSTFSGGVAVPNAGLESKTSGISEELRRRVHRGTDMLHERDQSPKKGKFSLSLPQQLGKGERPLQLIVVSATANSVMRNFLGAKTGWLRTGLKDAIRKRETGKWLDLTGLSRGVLKGSEVAGLEDKSQSGWPLQLPKELKHSCVVVDEPTGSDKVENWRALHPSLARRGLAEGEGEGKGEEEEEKKPSPARKEGSEQGKEDKTKRGPPIVAPTQSTSPSLDEQLLTCLAFLYASQPVHRALALIPPTWSISKCRAFLAELDIPVRFFGEDGDSSSGIDGDGDGNNEGGEPLYLIQANSVRGLDVPGGLSHVFCLGVESVRDTTNYTHLAGRAARIGHDEEGSHQRPPGHVITLVRGLSMDQVFENRRVKADQQMLTSSELKMSLIYKRLGLKVDTLRPLYYSQIDNLELQADDDADRPAQGP